MICVDWSAGAADPNYVRAAVNTRLVGKQVSILVEKINESIGKSITQRTHIVGFSLGAHVAGFAGSHLKNLSRITGKLIRGCAIEICNVPYLLSGLDPAGPLFEGYDGKVRLDKNDADYVDVIHSNGESVIVGGFGTWEPIGHVDFYPNGGRAQRGCQHFLVGGLYDFIYCKRFLILIFGAKIVTFSICSIPRQRYEYVSVFMQSSTSLQILHGFHFSQMLFHLLSLRKLRQIPSGRMF